MFQKKKRKKKRRENHTLRFMHFSKFYFGKKKNMFLKLAGLGDRTFPVTGLTENFLLMSQ